MKVKLKRGGTIEVDSKYLSIRRLASYLYEVTYDAIPRWDGSYYAPKYGCTSFVKDGKLYRNLDWYYGNTAEFLIKMKNCEGMSFIDGLEDGKLDANLIGQLPYRICDGHNDSGLMVSTHVLFNDWGLKGTGTHSVPLTMLPYFILTTMTNVNDVSSEVTHLLNNMRAPSMLIQVLVTDGTHTKLFTPTEDGYEYIDISANPKLTNFKWVNKATLQRDDEALQAHPTGIERWNLIEEEPDLSDLRFTLAYESDARLSEFIGIDGTDKDSSDAKLEAIYNKAHSLYLTRKRDNTLWQTVHSIVYSPYKIESLYTQENYNVERTV